MPNYPYKIKSKLPNVKTTIFTTVGKMAKQYDAINLSQGFPNFQPDQHLLDLVTKALNEGHNQYAHMAGLPELREIISTKIQTLHNRSYNPETEITVTNGASQAIFTAVTAFVESGDEVIVFKPAYDCYEPAIEVNNGIPVYVQLNEEFNVDWDVFRSKLSHKTKMVIINTPYEHIVFDGLEHESASRFDGLASRSFICASFGKTFHVTEMESWLLRRTR